MRKSNPAALTVMSLRKRYGETVLFDDLSFTVSRSEIILIFGMNGSGKTTLVNCISGFDRRYGGNVALQGKNVDHLFADSRSRLGLCRSFQSPHLFPTLTLDENITLGRQAGVGAFRAFWMQLNLGCSSDTFDAFALPKSSDRLASNLSLGEKKLLSIARVLATKANVLLLDEPLASLQDSRRDVVIDAIRQRASRGCAVVIIEHHIDAIAPFAERCYELKEGKLVEHRFV